MVAINSPMVWQPSTTKLRGFVMDRATGHPLPGVVVSIRVEPDENILVNLGLLVSDAAGYIAFDLAPYLERFTPNPRRIIVEALGDEGNRQELSSLGANRFGCDFMLRVDVKVARCRDQAQVALPSIQSPDLTDWELSPYSFVTKPDAALGDDCCAVPYPNSLPERELRFARVMRIAERGFLDDGVTDIPPINPQLSITSIELPRRLLMGYILEFSQRWYPLGHSIGQLIYSLPLAPCESVNIAVIEWEREEELRRGDRVVSAEQLFHSQRRDRDVDETVNAALQENQTGWSLMGGKANATSSSGSADLTSVIGFPLNVAGSMASLFSIGGSISSTSGTRNLTAESGQELHDRILQNTSVVRSLSSTVIIQTAQREGNLVQTRTVTNHNHCHALTIQYFEVLRHFKVITEYERRRRVVLIPYRIGSFDREQALRFRTILAYALLEPKLKSYFDALVRLEIGEDAYLEPGGNDEPAQSQGPQTDYFSGRQTVTVNASEIKQTGLLIEPGSLIQASAFGEGIKFSLDLGAGYGPAGETRIAKQPFPADGRHEYALLAQIGGNFYEIGAGASFTAEQGGSLRFRFNDWKLDDNSGSAEVEIAVTRPQPAPVPPPAPEPEPEQLEAELPSERSDRAREALLLNHLNSNLGYYNRAVWLLQDPVERRLMLEQALASRPDILDAVDDTPIAVSGNYLAFALNTGEDLEAQRAEDDRENPPQIGIASFPTRGVFAEAMLGHCNTCEVRDVTRFWNWTESPCEPAPEITGITPGPRGQTPEITPTSLPGPIVQVAQTPAAPDPIGLAAALQVLGTPNIFRDMSGLAEVSQLLETLANGTVTSMQDAQNIARQAQARLRTEQARPALGGSGGGATRQQSPSERYDNLQVAKEVAASSDELGLTEQQTGELTSSIIGGGGPGGGPLGFLNSIIMGATPKAIRSVPSARPCCLLGCSDAIEPAKVKDHKYGSTSLDNVGYVYTERAGIVDIAHLRDHADLTKYVYDAILAGQPNITCREGTATFAQSPADPIATAQAIAYVDSWAHELRTFGRNIPGLDNSAFSPEDLPSNFLGTYIGAMALEMMGSSSAFDATVDTLLAGMLASLGARSKADTETVIKSLEGVNKWWEKGWVCVDIKLVRRNFDGIPWLAGSAFDKPPIPSFIDPSTLTPLFASFDYASKPLLSDGSVLKLADFPTRTDTMRAPFKAAGTDRP